MLVLSRLKGQRLLIGDDIIITVVDIRGDKVRLGTDAPRCIAVHREEVYKQIKKDSKILNYELFTTEQLADELTKNGPSMALSRELMRRLNELSLQLSSI